MYRLRGLWKALAMAAVLLWVGGTRAAEEPATNTGPRISIEKETVDAGDVVRGAPANFTFVVHNTGTEVLKILSAKPG